MDSSLSLKPKAPGSCLFANYPAAGILKSGRPWPAFGLCKANYQADVEADSDRTEPEQQPYINRTALGLSSALPESGQSIASYPAAEATTCSRLGLFIFWIRSGWSGMNWKAVSVVAATWGRRFIASIRSRTAGGVSESARPPSASDPTRPATWHQPATSVQTALWLISKPQRSVRKAGDLAIRVLPLPHLHDQLPVGLQTGTSVPAREFIQNLPRSTVSIRSRLCEPTIHGRSDCRCPQISPRGWARPGRASVEQRDPPGASVDPRLWPEHRESQTRAGLRHRHLPRRGTEPTARHTSDQVAPPPVRSGYAPDQPATRAGYLPMPCSCLCLCLSATWRTPRLRSGPGCDRARLNRSQAAANPVTRSRPRDAAT